MKQYTIVYEDLGGDTQTYDTPAESSNEALRVMYQEDDLHDQVNEVLHVIEHKVPRLTVQVDGSVMASYADTDVELLIVDGHNDSVMDAAAGLEGSFLPSSRQAENLAYVLGDAYLWFKRKVDHLPDDVEFDFSFIADAERVEEFTQKVRRDAKEWS